MSAMPSLPRKSADQPQTRIRVDIDRCVGAGRCVQSAPGHFDQDDDGVVVLIEADVAAADEHRVREAADLCPGQAISIVAAMSRPGNSGVSGRLD